MRLEDGFASFVDELLKKGFIELEADWIEYVDRLAELIKFYARKYPVHIVLHTSRKFIDTYNFLIELELKIGNREGITVFLERDVESTAYHALMMGSFGKGIMFIIIPYDRRLCSQIENIRLVSCSKVFWRAVDKGWRIVLINPVVASPSTYETIVTPYTYRVFFSNSGDVRFIPVERCSTCVVTGRSC